MVYKSAKSAKMTRAKPTNTPNSSPYTPKNIQKHIHKLNMDDPPNPNFKYGSRNLSHIHYSITLICNSISTLDVVRPSHNTGLAHEVPSPNMPNGVPSNRIEKPRKYHGAAS